MPSHKSEDYKIIAAKYHLENNSSFVNTCKIFKCNERSLKRWINKYNNAFDKEQFKLPSQQSTRRRTLKKYKKLET